MSEQEYQGPSLWPDDSEHGGGGLFNNKPATWTDVKFALFTYKDKDGNAGATAPSLMVTFVPDDPEEETFTQNYSVGSKDFWAPTPDGKWITPVSKTKREINDNCNMHHLMTSLKEAGLPKSLLTARDITVLNGMNTLLSRKEIAGREDLNKDKPKKKQVRGADGQIREYEVDTRVLLVEKIIALPGEAAQAEKPKAGKEEAKGKKAGAAKKDAGAPAQSADAAKKAKNFILKQLAANDGKVNKIDLPNAVFEEFATDPDRNAILGMVFNDESIVGLGGFAVDNAGVVTAAA